MQDLICEILTDINHSQNAYFIHLKDHSFEKDDFLETQIQFFFAVVFFSRPMAVLAAKIPTPELRLEVLRNVWEEHGDGNLHQVHGKTFVTFLSRLAGFSEVQISQEIERRALWPEIRIFNTTLVGACVMDEYLIGVGLLGIIERMFCDISHWLGNSIVERGWLTRENMIHYNVHEQLDIKHSQDFFDVLEIAWKKDLANQYYIEQGLRLGATLFHNLYTGLYQQRKRRIFRTIAGPHSRAEGV